MRISIARLHDLSLFGNGQTEERGVFKRRTKSRTVIEQGSAFANGAHGPLSSTKQTS
jgi:hypothetical protein